MKTFLLSLAAVVLISTAASADSYAESTDRPLYTKFEVGGVAVSNPNPTVIPGSCTVKLKVAGRTSPLSDPFLTVFIPAGNSLCEEIEVDDYLAVKLKLFTTVCSLPIVKKVLRFEKAVR